ncbi:MAG: pyridoxamine 5'-phosphate oxidase family protein [Dehalococcoidia bacterium]|nr:pyridoxamine 5'-phosphate oxidase family protein [Dehalococcoidia bacterium]
MIWEGFKRSDPALAALGEERFQSTGLVMIGTLRKNGSPRISPVEPLIAEGHLYLGMMWQSRKALDLLRDPRCTVHSTVLDRDGSEGEFKVYGRAVDEQDAEMRRRYGDALYGKMGWRPEEPEYHLFSVDIESAAYAIIQDGEWIRKFWRAT